MLGMSYHEHTDPKFAAKIRAGAPAAFDAWMKFNQASLRNEDGVLSRKTVELLAVAVALTTQCPYCLEDHSNAAREAGVTEEELAETIMVAATLRAGAGLAHGFVAEKFSHGAEKAAD
ncbi:carboxymuconolactone decarboxylase family protein [Nocardioides bruguierae]|uniref:carboxymuconolactone decarboxylase family protein n=1 Tax=Nocardioides bruguierae TaxID=2945102 RepID=UPI0020218D2D|nr:carboxymuconolactone decarboxylase family protein [Nocardioides bruguierae]MCL8026903.1 carboxymuconolactone decarboxylase family protein [Nocardioides bruguierae]